MMKKIIGLILFFCLSLFNCAPEQQEQNLTAEEKTLKYNSSTELNELSVSKGRVSVTGNLSIDILQENDSTWKAYYFDDPSEFQIFYERNDGMIMYDVTCFQTCVDIIELDSLFNPLVLYRFENKTTNSYSEKKLVFLSYYVGGEELVQETVSRAYYLSWAPKKNEIEQVVDKIKISELPTTQFSNSDFFKKRTKYWMTIVDNCFGFYNHPMGDLKYLYSDK
ncbi:hypothetical protein [Crocinitomix catalasitica]|uniref:hypothetical protein n=1 Tax=Crocinitomix catalasitica TaxID=184607 RepID=UPI0012F7CEDC|nr:hypothetical protein [Crocinitomix catalasitica]